MNFPFFLSLSLSFLSFFSLSFSFFLFFFPFFFFFYFHYKNGLQNFPHTGTIASLALVMTPIMAEVFRSLLIYIITENIHLNNWQKFASFCKIVPCIQVLTWICLIDSTCNFMNIGSLFDLVCTLICWRDGLMNTAHTSHAFYSANVLLALENNVCISFLFIN